VVGREWMSTALLLMLLVLLLLLLLMMMLMLPKMTTNTVARTTPTRATAVRVKVVAVPCCPPRFLAGATAAGAPGLRIIARRR
jgi:hypothetical protein